MRFPRVTGLFMATCLMSPLAHAAPSLQTIVVGNGTGPSGASYVASLNDIRWPDLAPGSIVYVAPGTYTGTVTIIGAQGDAVKPILIRPLDQENLPIISKGAIDIHQSGYLSISGVVVDGATYSGALIRNGSHHIRLANSIFRNNGHNGIQISDGAGVGNRIARNEIYNNAINGIGVGWVNATLEDPTRILHNHIHDNATHGIELSGSRYVVSHNEVHDNGRVVGGASGIHLYANNAAQKDVCNENTITYNISYNNHDATLDKTDGNGIQVDHWCDKNTVAYNIAYGNDGAGISLYDAAENKVYGNTLFDNAHDQRRGWRGELLVTSQGADVDRTASNVIYDNIIVATQQRAGADANVWPPVAPIVVDYLSVDGNSIGPNLIHNRAASPLMYWGSGNKILSTIAQVNDALGTSGNLNEAPLFVNEAAPLDGGLKLAKRPSSAGQAITAEWDIEQKRSKPGYAFFGAYYTP